MHHAFADRRGNRQAQLIPASQGLARTPDGAREARCATERFRLSPNPRAFPDSKRPARVSTVHPTCRYPAPVAIERADPPERAGSESELNRNPAARKASGRQDARARHATGVAHGATGRPAGVSSSLPDAALASHRAELPGATSHSAECDLDKLTTPAGRQQPAPSLPHHCLHGQAPGRWAIPPQVAPGSAAGCRAPDPCRHGEQP